MTDEQLKQWMTDAIIKIIHPQHGYPTKKDHYDCCTEAENKAKWILELKTPDGTPAIGIISDDQSEVYIEICIPAKNADEQDSYVKLPAKSAGFVRLVGGKK